MAFIDTKKTTIKEAFETNALEAHCQSESLEYSELEPYGNDHESPSRSESLCFIDSAKSLSTKTFQVFFYRNERLDICLKTSLGCNSWPYPGQLLSFKANSVSSKNLSATLKGNRKSGWKFLICLKTSLGCNSWPYPGQLLSFKANSVSSKNLSATLKGHRKSGWEFLLTRRSQMVLRMLRASSR